MNIALLGDLAFTGILSSQEDLNIKRFETVSPFLNSIPLVFANLEVPVKVDESKNENKNIIHFSLPKPTKELLRILNIGCVSLANNHIYDCKMSGLKATISLLDELGIKHTGAGWLKEHCEPIIITKRISIGFIAYVGKNTNPKTDNFSELFLNYFDIKKVKEDVAFLRNKVDKIICSIHWGNDYSYYPTQEQVNNAKYLIDSGVDVIMGHHPHTFQLFENYKQGVIFYSLGGLTFGDFIKNGEMYAIYRKTKKAAIVKYDLLNRNIFFLPTKELKGNYIVVDNRNYFKWSNKKWHLYRLKNSSPFINHLFLINEKIVYRVYEYFFGYYKNPISRFFQFRNILKIKKLFKDVSEFR